MKVSIRIFFFGVKVNYCLLVDPCAAVPGTDTEGMQYVEQKVPVRVHNYALDSRLRNTELYPEPNQYVVDIPTPFRNVVKVDLVSAVYQKFGIENYVNLHIEELSGNLESNNSNVRGIFAQLPLLYPLNFFTKDDMRATRLFERPLSRLARLTISFLDFDGRPYPMQDHTLRFEVHALKNAGDVENRHLDLFSDYANVYVPVSAPFPDPRTPMSPCPPPPESTGAYVAALPPSPPPALMPPHPHTTKPPPPPVLRPGNASDGRTPAAAFPTPVQRHHRFPVPPRTVTTPISVAPPVMGGAELERDLEGVIGHARGSSSVRPSNATGGFARF